MKINNPVGIGMMGMMLQDGVIIEKFDEMQQKIYIKIPSDSFAYHDRNSDIITDAESYAKRIKEMLAELMHLSNLKLYYKTYYGYWTKEQGDKNMKEHIHEYL